MYSLSNLHIREPNRQGMARTTRIVHQDHTGIFHDDEKLYVSIPDNFAYNNHKEDLSDDAYIARLNDLAYAKSEIAYALSIHNS